MKRIIGKETRPRPDPLAIAAELFGSGVDVLKRVVAKGDVFASPEVVSAHLAICEGSGDEGPCPALVNGRCLDLGSGPACGCVIKVKVRFAALACPRKKWAAG